MLQPITWKEGICLENEERIKIKNFLQDSLILLNTDYHSSGELFKGVSDIAYGKGFVNAQFLPKIMKRETTFPTGLQLEENGVAIPHTDADTIKKEFVAVVVSGNGVDFKRMDDPTQSVKAHLIFVLGLNQPHAQLEMLQELMEVIQNKDLLKNICEAPDKEAVRKLLS